MSGRSRFAAGALCWSAAFAFALLAVSVLPGRAQDLQYVRTVTIPVNKSATLLMPAAFSSAVVGAPEIADALPMTDRTLLIQAKKIGTTNISVFNSSNQLIKVVEVQVSLDLGSLASKIRALTRDPGIRVSSENGQVVLSGVARNAANADEAFNLAKSWAPNGNVVNAMRIASPQQVLLKVRFLEVDRNAGRELGININGTNASGTRGVSTGLGQVTATNPTITGAGGTGTPLSTNSVLQPLFQATGTLVGHGVGAPFGTVLAEIVNNGVKIDTLVTALETKNLLRRLAEPNLVALSGQVASFEAGGQIPVPIAVTSGIGIATPTIEFKDFGVLLKFRPTVLGDGIINLSINPEVSNLDFTNAVTISGTTIPALTRRTATTTVELRDGQSFAIAGLLQADNSRDISQVPWLGSVPVLGTLFRSSAFQKQETDLVIIVTPHLVQPAPPGARLASPLDSTIPTNDVDFFLFGETERRKQFNDYVTSGGDVRGPYGDMIGIIQDPPLSRPQK
jgi:pilus assembly protein CpaC